MVEQTKNCYHHEDRKEQSTEYWENKKEKLHEQAWNKYKDLSNEKKDIERKVKESMKETDIEICLKKINKNLGNIKKGL